MSRCCVVFDGVVVVVVVVVAVVVVNCCRSHRRQVRSWLKEEAEEAGEQGRWGEGDNCEYVRCCPRVNSSTKFSSWPPGRPFVQSALAYIWHEQAPHTHVFNR